MVCTEDCVADTKRTQRNAHNTLTSFRFFSKNYPYVNKPRGINATLFASEFPICPLIFCDLGWSGLLGWANYCVIAAGVFTGMGPIKFVGPVVDCMLFFFSCLFIFDKISIKLVSEKFS